MKKIAISVGDINGVGLELIINNHNKIKKICKPTYFADKKLLKAGAKLLKTKLPNDMKIYPLKQKVKIQAGKISKESGLYSYNSFLKAVEQTAKGKFDAVCTLPIHKEAWMQAGIEYKGHTDMLRSFFGKNAIMMLGCPKLFVPLYTEHIPLKRVPQEIKTKKLYHFLKNLNNSLEVKKIAVLGLNPHAGDGGAIGDEEIKIKKAIKRINRELKKELFFGPFVPDIAFTPNFRKNYNYICAMYHDQGLAPLKALYFDESVNISLNLPIVRTSVDHGTAFDIAYKNKAKSKSYLNAIKSAIKLSKRSKGK